MIKINLVDGGHDFRGGGENPRRGQYFRRLLGSYGQQRGNGQRGGDPSILQTSRDDSPGLISRVWRGFRLPDILLSPCDITMGLFFAGWLGFVVGGIVAWTQVLTWIAK